MKSKFLRIEKRTLFVFEKLIEIQDKKGEFSNLLKILRKNQDYKWSEQTIKDALSDLNTVFKDYIFLRDSKQKKSNYALILGEFYLREGLSLHLPTLNNYLEQDDSLPSYTKYSDAFVVYHKLAVHDKKIRGRKTSDNFDLAVKNLNYAYWIETLKLECEIKNRREKVKYFEQESIFEANHNLLSFVRQNYGDNRLISLYSGLYNLSTEEDFYKLYKEWSLSLEDILQEDAKTISIYLLNYCIDHITLGREDYAKVYLEISKNLIEKNLLLEDGVLLDATFNNISSLALKARDIEWARYFIDNFHPFLLEKEKSNVYKLCKAKLLFSESKFKEASDLLIEINMQKDFFFNVSVNILLIKCYVELDMIKVALTTMNNIELSINRAKESFSSSIFAETCLKFLSYLKEVLKDNPKLIILDSDKLVEREWLETIIKKRQ
ncbi:MAG: hypothetical protein H6579_09820 [Chitinophagales bacterium]|nr:hypothetical protein [Chitinophagales bacterium]